MKIFLTGSTGFLGSALLSSFLEQGHDVIVTRRGPSHENNLSRDGGVCDFCGTTQESLAAMFGKHKDIDVIVHAATDYGQASVLPTSVFTTNVSFPISLLEFAMTSSVGMFVNIDTFFNSKNIEYQYLGEYALSKRQFQEWGEVCGRHRSIRFVNLRLFHLYGPGDRSNKFVSSIISKCLRDKQIDLTEGTQRRDFIFLEDAICAIDMAVRAELGKPADFVNYDVGTGTSISIREFVEMIRRLGNSHSVLNFGVLPSRVGEFSDACADVQMLQKIGWSPATTLENGLRATIASQRQRED